MFNIKNLTLLLSSLLLGACATTNTGSSIPKGVVTAPDNDIQYTEVVADISGAIGTQVRWGGKILKRERLGETGWRLTVIEHPIKENGRPDNIDAEQDYPLKSGRYIVEIDNTVDLKRVARNNFITLSGEVSGQTALEFGKKSIEVPVISASEAYVWRNRRDYHQFNRYYFAHNYRHYWRDPFWYHRFHTIHIPRHHFHYRKKSL